MSTVANMQPNRNRRSEVTRVRADLVENGFPRLRMLLIVALTGGAGFLASFVLRALGVATMAVRYPAAVGVAYLVFLFLLWLWLRTSAEDYADLADLPSGSNSRNCSAECHGEVPVPGEPPVSDDGGAISEVIGGAAQAEELAIPLLLLIAVAAVAFSSLWIVYSAPSLFAELLVDGVLSATLYRRLRGIETRHWLETAVRRTIAPFAITAVVAGFCGAVMHLYYPSATSLGEVVRSASADDRAPPNQASVGHGNSPASHAS